MLVYDGDVDDNGAGAIARFDDPLDEPFGPAIKFDAFVAKLYQLAKCGANELTCSL